MKNYYYILGVSATATDEEIRTAYRKLSIKFHPDQNGGDAFFRDHFKEIQEAYETLSQPERRAAYNTAFLSPKERAAMDNNRPIIQSFETSKTAIQDHEHLTLSWEVVHADRIEIEGVGRVSARGTKTVRLPQIRQHAQLKIVLRAVNSNIDQSAEKSVWIKNKSYTEQPTGQPVAPPLPTKQERTVEEPVRPRFIERDDREVDEAAADTLPLSRRQSARPQDKETPAKATPRNDIYVYFIVFILLAFVAILAYIVFQMNGL